jgi:hypothetical protein
MVLPTPAALTIPHGRCMTWGINSTGQWINSSIALRGILHGSEERRENGAGGLTLIEHLSFGLQPVLEGTVVPSATLFIQGVGSLQDTRMGV